MQSGIASRSVWDGTRSWATQTRSMSAIHNTARPIRCSTHIQQWHYVRRVAHVVRGGRILGSQCRCLIRIMTNIRELPLETQRQGNKAELLQASGIFHLERQQHSRNSTLKYGMFLYFVSAGSGFKSRKIRQYFLLPFKTVLKNYSKPQIVPSVYGFVSRPCN